MATMKKSAHAKGWQGWEGTGVLTHGWWERKMLGHFSKQYGTFLKGKHTISNSTSSYLPKGVGNRHPFKDVYTTIPRSFICNSPKTGNGPNVHQEMNGETNFGASVQRNMAQR